MPTEYIIYCDESDEKGRHFSNFYGGILIHSDDIDEARATIKQTKQELNLFAEVKWHKITANYANKYIALMEAFFTLVAAGKIKVRIMFTQNTIIARGLTAAHQEEKYFVLYYQFLKHAFGLAFSPPIAGGVDLRIYPDRLPDTFEQIERFKSFLVSLTQYTPFRHRGIRVKKENVTEVDSHEHDLLQCLDIILGAMQFRLNDKHLDKPAGSRRRAKRTIAKERVYRFLNGKLRELRPNFNIGITTGDEGVDANRWDQLYRHWRFVPKKRIIIPGSKRRKR